MINNYSYLRVQRYKKEPCQDKMKNKV